MRLIVPSGAAELSVPAADYAWFLDQTEVPLGAYLFTGVTRMDEPQRHLAAGLEAALIQAGATVLNRPSQLTDRCGLMQKLPGRQVRRSSTFPTGLTYPLVLRFDDASPSIEVLVLDEDSLQEELTALVMSHYPLDRIYAVQVLEDTEGRTPFTTGSCLRIQDSLTHGAFAEFEGWFGSGRLLPPEEAPQINESTLTNLFQTLNLDAGRIDYMLVNGQLAVWRIDDTPEAILRGTIEQDTEDHLAPFSFNPRALVETSMNRRTS